MPGNDGTHSLQRIRRPSSVYYANENDRCHWLLSNKKDRCKSKVVPKTNLCPYHTKIREEQKKYLEEMLKKKHAAKSALIKKVGGKETALKKKIFDYDYYLDDEIEPFDSNASRVTPKIWIGSIDSAHDPDFLKKMGIKSLINCSGMEPNHQIRDMYNKLGIDYYTLSKVEQLPNKPVYTVTGYLSDQRFTKKEMTPREFFKHLHKGVQIINQPSFKFPALIFCHAGINRSASLIAAYLQTKPKPYTYERTMQLLKNANERRGLDVLTNEDFRHSLKFFPIFMGTKKDVNPSTMSRYKSYLSSYEM